jgi:hypothetical protein
MKTRLALVAFEGPATGPWVRTRGNETGVQISVLGEGECVFMDWEANGSPKEPVLFFHEGTFDLPEGWDKVRFRKESAGLKTNVSIVHNG